MAKILIVDDSETQRFEIKSGLQSAGHEVVEGVDGADGFKKLNETKDVSLIVCDLNMPVMNGLTMCQKIHESGQFQGLPIFMLTTEASPELKAQAKQFGVRAWITKPMDLPKFLEAVSKVTAKK